MLARRVLVPGFVLFYILVFSTDTYACHWYGVLDLGLHGRRDHASLKKQNSVADLHGLERLDEQKLQKYIAQGKLERLADPPLVFYYLDIAEERFKYALPETKIFAERDDCLSFLQKVWQAAQVYFFCEKQGASS